MTSNYLEHANITVAEPEKSADLLCRIFDWEIRWQGQGMDVGHTVHVGNANSYVAFYTQPDISNDKMDSYRTLRMTNHLGIVVENFEEIHKRVVAEGLTPGQVYEYEPGRRFYFHTPDDIEIEVVSY